MELFAYLDPFTGSLILQVLAMAFVSILIFFQRCRAFVLGLFGFKQKPTKKLDEDSENADKTKEETP